MRAGFFLSDAGLGGPELRNIREQALSGLLFGEEKLKTVCFDSCAPNRRETFSEQIASTSRQLLCTIYELFKLVQPRR
jgi:hypothetical protein